MQGVGKIASLLLTSAVACTMLAACHGSGTSATPSTAPPTVGAFSCPLGNTTGAAATAGIVVTCTVTGAISSDGAAVTYNWNFGDQPLAGSTQLLTGSPVTHFYAQPGNYQVTVNVIDDHGTGASRVQTVSVPVPVPANSTVNPNGVENWAWIGGAKYANSPGDFQTQFVASAANQPSARQSAASWTSPQGMLWMFGGVGADSAGTTGALNDLWMYNPMSPCTAQVTTGCSATGGQWTWVSGSNRANSVGIYPATTGVTASSNVISARSAPVSWTSIDTNGVATFWLFGGSGYDKNGIASYLNDLWSLNSQTGEATWVAGSGIGNSASVAGTQGTGSTANSPAGRAFAASWTATLTDNTQVFYLFGGESVNSTGTPVFFDDLWSYDPNPQTTTPGGLHPNGKQGWVLVSAAATATAVNTTGTYGAQAGTTGNPGARISPQTWTDKSGNLWLFGGQGFDGHALLGSLNDLWMYNPLPPCTSQLTTGCATTGGQQWTWITGSSINGAVSVYGNQGSTVAANGASANVPGGRLGASGWVDPTKGYLWLFGGSGADSTSTTTANDGGGALNELWVFNPKNGLWAWMGGVKIEGTAGVYVSATPSTIPSNYNTPGSRVWGTSWFVPGSANNFYLFGGTGLDSAGTSGYLNDLWTVQTNVAPTN